MNLIVAVNENFGIGKDGKLLYSLSKDMNYFKEKTKGKIVIMGDKTLESLPNGKPLEKRTNLILSNNPNLVVKNAQIFNDLESLLKHVSTLPEDDVFVIGGAMVYELLLPYCKKAYITHIYDTKEADRFFPDITQMPNWILVEKGPIQTENNISFAFCIYKNLFPLPLK